MGRNSKTNELLVKLLIQQNKELQEDLTEVLRHTPGAAVLQRPDSFRRRACRTSVKNLLFTTHSSLSGDQRTTTHSSIASPFPSFQHVPTYQRPEESKSDETLEKMREMISIFNSSQQEVRELISQCSQHMEACDRRVSEV